MLLNFRIVRGPLRAEDNEVILKEYNRLTSVQIPMIEFVRWLQNGPAGPAWHAILETDEGRIVGHTSVFPLQTVAGGSTLIPAKSEYSFLHEDFRSVKIRSFETVARPSFIIILDQLFQHCLAQNWSPIFASTAEKNQVFTRKVGLRPLAFPLWECLFILKPGMAAKNTPNLETKHRAALLAAGTFQKTAWSLAQVTLNGKNGPRPAPLLSTAVEPIANRLAFFEDADSLRWRYIDGQYVRFSLRENSRSYIIAKCGGSDRYLRVCQWRLQPEETTSSLIVALLREAQKQGAMGLRWAVYDGDATAAALVSLMRKAGFLCARRDRTIMVHKNDPRYLVPEAWNMNDSLFSFDP